MARRNRNIRTIAAKMSNGIYSAMGTSHDLREGTRLIAEIVRNLLESDENTLSDDTLRAIRNKVNGYLSGTAEVDRQSRIMVATIFSGMLHDIGEYHGFNYVYWIHEGGCDKWHADGEPMNQGIDHSYLFNGDDSRIFYYGF